LDNTLEVDLEFPNLVKLEDKIIGVWSMVYDEGFEIFISDEEVNDFSMKK